MFDPKLKGKKNGIDHLNSIAVVNKEFLLRQLSIVTEITAHIEYSSELKDFALTLHFYSKAVNKSTFI